MVGRRAPRGYRAGFAHGLCRRRTVYRFSDGDNLCNGDFSPVDSGILSRAEHETEGDKQYQNPSQHVDGASEHILVHRVAFQMPPRQVRFRRDKGSPKAGVGQPSQEKECERVADDVMTRAHFVQLVLWRFHNSKAEGNRRRTQFSKRITAQAVLWLLYSRLTVDCAAEWRRSSPACPSSHPEHTQHNQRSCS